MHVASAPLLFSVGSGTLFIECEPVVAIRESDCVRRRLRQLSGGGPPPSIELFSCSHCMLSLSLTHKHKFTPLSSTMVGAPIASSFPFVFFLSSHIRSNRCWLWNYFMRIARPTAMMTTSTQSGDDHLNVVQRTIFFFQCNVRLAQPSPVRHEGMLFSSFLGTPLCYPA